MLFSSPAFFVFFAIYFALHCLVPTRLRLGLILASSTFFYGWWNPAHVWIPFALVAIAHAGALWLDPARGQPALSGRLAAVVSALLLPLAAIKYLDFFYAGALGAPLGPAPALAGIAPPLGISFITFTLIAYVVEVHRGTYPVEPSAGRLAGLALFFPHLIAGPILRPHELLPRLAFPRPARRALAVRVTFGLAIFSLGLAKKLVVADPLGEAVDVVYAADPGSPSAQQYLLALYAFPVQIYCDFSGYTDMAIGVAMLLGVRLPLNFHAPYGSASITEFWRRWHVTLSSWLRDYVYIPLGGSRHGLALQMRNAITTLVLGGLWHGASWTFVLWGLLHGMLLATEQGLERLHVASLPRAVRIALTFHLVALGWILFRAPDLSTAQRVLSGPFRAPLEPSGGFVSAHGFALLLIALVLVTHPLDTHRSVRRAVRRLPPPLLAPLIALAWILSIAVSQGSTAKFIYFDF